VPVPDAEVDIGVGDLVQIVEVGERDLT